MPGFWDSSAIVPFAPFEKAGQGRRLLRLHSPVVWWSAHAEAIDALCCRERARVLAEEQYAAAGRRLESLQSGLARKYSPPTAGAGRGFSIIDL